MDIISLALEEDIATGDVTAELFTPAERMARADVVARNACVLAGTATAVEIFRRVDETLEIETLCRDGDSLERGDVALRVAGRARSILTAERTVLNFLQRLSGVATLTRKYVDAVVGTGVQILDTRKTTPGFRKLEKAAVVAGGGRNHRMGLYDMVMVKDNHLLAGATPASMQPAIAAAKARGLRVEVEVDSIGQLREVFALDGVDVVLLDNMKPEQLREAVALRAEMGKTGVLFEASGGVTLETIRAIAETGVDFISVGALTHSAVAVDIALDFLE